MEKDYKKMYEDALNKAMNLTVSNNISALAAGEIFPELKESEDDRIRKEIIAYLDVQNVLAKGKDGDFKEWIAWLEKQGKQKAKVESNKSNEKKELTEFEKAVENILNYPHFQDTQAVKQFSKTLLELARKELEANYYTKVLDDRMLLKAELHATDLQTAYDMGKRDALKDMPKWKNINQIQAENHYAHIANGIINPSGYFISYDDLETLPKEESYENH